MAATSDVQLLWLLYIAAMAAASEVHGLQPFSLVAIGGMQILW